MKDLTKMMLFMFLGLIFAILVLGFHRSGETTGLAKFGVTNTPASKPASFDQGVGF